MEEGLSLSLSSSLRSREKPIPEVGHCLPNWTNCLREAGVDIVKVLLEGRIRWGKNDFLSISVETAELVDWVFGRCGRLDDQSYDPEINLSTGHSAKVNSFLLHVEWINQIFLIRLVSVDQWNLIFSVESPLFGTSLMELHLSDSILWMGSITDFFFFLSFKDMN